MALGQDHDITHQLVIQNKCKLSPISKMPVKSYRPDIIFGYVCILVVSLTLENWPWNIDLGTKFYTLLGHDYNCVKYQPNPTYNRKVMTYKFRLVHEKWHSSWTNIAKFLQVLNKLRKNSFPFFNFLAFYKKNIEFFFILFNLIVILNISTGLCGPLPGHKPI